MSIIFKIIPPIRVLQFLGLLVEIYNEVKAVLKPLTKSLWLITVLEDLTVNGKITWRSWVIPQIISGAMLLYILLAIYAGAGSKEKGEEE